MQNKKVFEFMKNENFVASKKLGQNFLINNDIKKRIVDNAELQESDLVIEIGPGLGAISEIILNQKNNLLAIELDKRLFAFLNNKYKERSNFTIVNNDYLKLDIHETFNTLDFKDSIKRKIVIANLPYSISSSIIAKMCLENFYDYCIIMVQKEMAQRIVAKCNTKHYNAFTVWLAKFINVKFLFDVSPKNFNPIPKVMSSVIRINFKEQKDNFEYADYRSFLNKCFLARRKTLFNNLLCYYNRDKILSIFNEFDITLTKRAQEINSETFFDLFIRFNKKEE